MSRIRLAGLGAVASELTYPDAINTGWQAYPASTGTLTTYGGSTVLRAANSGTQASPVVYENLAFDNGITIGVPGDEAEWITLRGCRIRKSGGSGTMASAVCGNNIRFEYCTFEPANTQTPPFSMADSYQYGVNINTPTSNGHAASSVTVDHCEMYGFGNAVQLYSSTQADPIIVQHCYIHDAADQPNAVYHHDGVLSPSNSILDAYLVIHHNTIWSGGNTNAIALQSAGGSYSHVVITNNLLGGFGYTVNIADGYGSGNQYITFEDNTYWLRDPLCCFGPFKSAWPGLANNCHWRRNKFLYYPGNPKGADLDGKYWLPSSAQFNGGTPGSGDWSFSNLSALGLAGDTDYTG